MFFLFKESQVVISRGILSPFATKNLIFLFQAAVSTELLELKVFSVPVGLLVVLLVARKTWWELPVTCMKGCTGQLTYPTKRKGGKTSTQKWLGDMTYVSFHGTLDLCPSQLHRSNIAGLARSIMSSTKRPWPRANLPWPHKSGPRSWRFRTTPSPAAMHGAYGCSRCLRWGP